MVLPVSTMSSTMTMLAPYNFLMSWIPWMPTEPEGRVSIFMKSNATWIEVWDRVELNLFTLSGSKKVYHLKTSFSGRLKKQLTKELKVSPGQVSLGRTCILLWRLEKADSEDLWQPGPKMNKGWGNWIHCDKLLLVLVRCKGSGPVQNSWKNMFLSMIRSEKLTFCLTGWTRANGLKGTCWTLHLIVKWFQSSMQSKPDRNMRKAWRGCWRMTLTWTIGC